MRGILSAYSKGQRLFFSSFMPLFAFLILKNFNLENTVSFFSKIMSDYAGMQFMKATLTIITKFGTLILFWMVVCISLIYSSIATYRLKQSIDKAVAKAKEKKSNFRCNKNSLIGYNDILTYLMTYVLALISWSPEKLGDMVVNVCLLGIVFIFYSKQKQLAYNIFLYLWGYNILTLEGTTLLTKLSLKETQGKIRRNGVLYMAKIYGDITILIDPDEDKIFD